MNIPDFHRVARMVEQLQPNLDSYHAMNQTAAAAAERYAKIERMVEQLQPNLDSYHAMNQTAAAAAESPTLPAGSTDAVPPPSSSANLQDVPEGVLEVETVELLLRLSTWFDLHGVLVGIEGLEAARLEVAKQIDECLSRLARSVDTEGVCWGCGGATLVPFGVACAECVGIVAQMMLEAVFLAEEFY